MRECICEIANLGLGRRACGMDSGSIWDNVRGLSSGLVDAAKGCLSSLSLSLSSLSSLLLSSSLSHSSCPPDVLQEEDPTRPDDELAEVLAENEQLARVCEKQKADLSLAHTGETHRH